MRPCLSVKGVQKFALKFWLPNLRSSVVDVEKDVTMKENNFVTCIFLNLRKMRIFIEKLDYLWHQTAGQEGQ